MKSDMPKVLHPVCGRPIIQYVLDVAKSVGSLKTFVVLGHKNKMVEEVLGDGVVPVLQSKLLGTADAVKTTQNYFKNYAGDVLILCGDTPLLDKATVRKIVQKHRKSKSICTFLTAVVHDPNGYGRIIRDDRGAVTAIREDKDALGYERDIAEINVGAYCFRGGELFKALKEIKLNEIKKEFYLTDIIELLYNQGAKMETVETEDSLEGLGVNTRQDLSTVQQAMRRKILDNFMSQGVSITDPATTYIDVDAKIGYDTIIHPFTVIERDVRIGKGCQVGPFARLRPGTRLEDHVEVGNFTELSRAKIGSGTLMKHFSFLGDSVVGADVNIGAGVVTANFDGQDKHTTRIEKNAFIGCNAVLVAPAKIGKKAVVGAGSVVPKRKTVPENSVVVGVPAKIISGKKSK